MTRHTLLPALLALLAVLGAAWFLLRDGPAEDAYVEPTPSAGRRAPAAPAGEAALALEGRPASEEPAPSRPPRVSTQVRPEDVPRGGLVVTAVAPDGKAYPPGEARVFLDSAGRALWWTPSGVPDPEKNTWTFERIPAGRVRLRVTGDHVVETSEEVVVDAGEVKEVTLHADRAGAVAYKVVLYSGEMPNEVTLALFDVDRKPVRAQWQVRMPHLMTTPRSEVKVVQAPEGVAFGIPPGKYRLSAMSPEEETDDVEVLVTAGRTESVEIRLRK